MNINGEKNFIKIPDELFSSVATKHFSGQCDIEHLEYNSANFLFCQPVDYSLEISNVGEGLYVDGEVSGSSTSTCGRCLEDVAFEVCAKVQLLFLFKEPNIGHDEYCEDEVLPSNRKISVLDICVSSILQNLPNKVLCKDDCKGLCPNCGQNLNEGTCECSNNQPIVDSPFAVLKDFKVEERSGS